jgi:dipeptidyl aminopeptidase/acylaminoacyl peptidase
VGLLALAGIGARVDAAESGAIPLDDFIRHSQFLDVKISPTGKYLAATILATEDTGALVVLDRATLKMTGNFKLKGKTLVNNFDWVNDERLILTVAEKDGALSNPRATGDLYAMDADGKNQALLIGPKQTGGSYRGGFLQDEIYDDDRFVLVRVFGVGNDEGDYPTLERMHVNTGKRTIVARAPVLNAEFLTDHEQNARFAWGDGVDTRQTLYYRGAKGGEWEVINDERTSGARMQPLGFDRASKIAYIQSTEKDGPDAIYAWDTATRERKLVARDDNVDPLNLVDSYDRKQPWGVLFMDGTPRIQALDPAAPEAMLRQMLAASFPGSWISLTSYTRDANLVVFRVWSDRNPGEFYLFDRAAKKATYLLATREWVDAEAMAVMKPISYKARDGVTIHGYLTLPKGAEGKRLPLILNPHGGPIGPYDDWGYNPEVQLFASRGYAVLQVNYRGSGNYGNAFLHAGYREWGGKMIDDMTDAVRWAIAEGVADGDRVCIYGASYGGYASAQALVREPKLYKCGVGYVGVYDMPMMYTYGDIPDRDSGTNFLREALGANQDFLREISPSRNAAKIEAPMFLIVGNDDVRAHPKHSRAMRDALKDAGKPVEWLEKDYEGHGFFKEENKRELYTKMLAFFDKHIGAGAAATTASNNTP